MAKLLHKIQSPGSHWQWVMTSERQIYPPQIQVLWQRINEFFPLHSHVAYTIAYCFLWIVMFDPEDKLFTHVEQGDGDGPCMNHVYHKSKAISTSCHWFKIQSSIHNWVIIQNMLPFKARSTLQASTLIILKLLKCSKKNLKNKIIYIYYCWCHISNPTKLHWAYMLNYNF
jgi:hypothetical protein